MFRPIASRRQSHSVVASSFIYDFERRNSASRRSVAAVGCQRDDACRDYVAGGGWRRGGVARATGDAHRVWHRRLARTNARRLLGDERSDRHSGVARVCHLFARGLRSLWRARSRPDDDCAQRAIRAPRNAASRSATTAVITRTALRVSQRPRLSPKVCRSSSSRKCVASALCFDCANEKRRHAQRRTQVVATPLVPFAVLLQNLAAGLMVTASHNPKEDNGYKVRLDAKETVTTKFIRAGARARSIGATAVRSFRRSTRASLRRSRRISRRGLSMYVVAALHCAAPKRVASAARQALRLVARHRPDRDRCAFAATPFDRAAR